MSQPDLDQSLKDRALAAALSRDAEIEAVGPPPKTNRELSREDLDRLMGPIHDRLHEAFGDWGYRNKFRGIDGQRIFYGIEQQLTQAFIDGIEAAENTHFDHVLAVGAASSRGILRSILGDNEPNQPKDTP